MKFQLILTIAILFFSLSAPVLMAQGNQVLSLDGDGDYVDIEVSLLNNQPNWTISIWIHPSSGGFIYSEGTPLETFGIILNQDGSIHVGAWNLHLNPPEHWKGYTTPPNVISFGAWNFISVTLEGGAVGTGNLKVYVNEASFSATLQQEFNPDTRYATIGNNVGSTRGGEQYIAYFNGLIDEVRIWNYALTQEEIQATMNTILKDNEPGLVGYWNFDDGTANDSSPNGNHGSLKGDAKIVESDLAIAPIFVAPQSIIPRTVGESFSLGIDTTTHTNLHNFTFDLAFDPDVLHAVSVEPGSFFSNDDNDPITCETPQIDNATGRITGISCKREGADGVSGSGTLAQITFEAIGVGESALRIENAIFSDPDGKQIEFGVRDGFITVFGPHGRIIGRVIDFQGKPVSGIEVLAFKEDARVGISGKTDFDGNYVIENLTEAGEVTVRARKAGLLPGIATVSVQIGVTNANVDFVLEQPGSLNSVVDENGFIRNWLLLGPIPWENDANRLMTDYFAVTDPEKPIQPQEPETKPLQPIAGEYGKGFAKTLRWTLHKDSDGDIDLASLYGQSKAVVYAFTLVKSLEEKRDVTLQLGSDNGIMCWFNDELVHFKGVTRNRKEDQDTVADLTLNAGWNRLLIKVENQGDAWGFLARFAEGKDLTLITDLDIFPQWQSRIVPGGEIKEFSIQIPLNRGINMISLPLNPETPYTASTFATALNATIVIQVKDGGFDAYVRTGSIGADFPIRAGNGYIVNLIEEQNFQITGKPWGEPVPAAPSARDRVSSRNSVSINPWAFVIAGQIDGEIPVGGKLCATNLRTKESIVAPISPSGQFTVAFVDMSQRPVVSVGDEFIVQLIGADGTSRLHVLQTETSKLHVLQTGTSRLHVLQDDIARAYLLTHLSARPEQTILLQNYPNPFNPETWIPYQLVKPADVSIHIYNARGQLIYTLFLGQQNAGFYFNRSNAAYWNGRNTSGERVGSGLYFYQLKAGDFTAIRRMVIVK